MQEILSTTLSSTEKIAIEFIKKVAPPAAGGATLVCLKGDLGSGKTTFTQCVGRALGVTETMTSPTFVIEKIYKLQSQIFNHLIHIDAYRLESGRELSVLGFDKIIQDPKNLILLEWPERVFDILPKEYTQIDFKFVNEQTRKITLPFTIVS